MTDFIDQTLDIEQRQLDRAIAASHVPIAAGEPGICDGCAAPMPRLVGGLCGYCRDGRR